MTKVYISHPLPLSNTELGLGWQGADESSVDEILHRYSMPYDYASFEANGIDLKAPGKLAKSDSPIGIVSSQVGVTENNAKFSVWFPTPQLLTEDVYFVLKDQIGKEIPVPVTYGIDVGVILFADADRTSAYQGYMHQESHHTVQSSIKVDKAYLGNTTYPYVGEIIIILSNVPGQPANKFVRVTNVYIGEGASEATVIGHPEVHGAISPVFDDLSIVTADLTVEADTQIEAGDEINLESPAFTQGFLIDSIERLAEDIYSLKCSDQVSMATDWTVYNNSEYGRGNLEYDSGSPEIFAENLLNFCPLSFLDGFEHTLTGFKTGTPLTARQSLAMYQATCMKTLTTWGSSLIRHIDWASPVLNGESPVITRTLTAHDLLDRASFKKGEAYGYIYAAFSGKVYYNNAVQDVEYAVTVNVPDNKGSRKQYDFSKITYYEGTAISDTPEDTMEKIAQIINGDEIEAPIDYQGESLGDWVSIVTPYNGTKTGYISEINLTLGAVSAVANIKVKVVE